MAEYDAAGTLEGGSAIHATARDWARFGEFLRLQGTVQGVRVVPSVLRVTFWGAAAIAVTAGVGALFGVAV